MSNEFLVATVLRHVPSADPGVILELLVSCNGDAKQVIELLEDGASSDDIVRPKELGIVSQFKELEHLVDSIMNDMPDSDPDIVRELVLTFDGDINRISEILGPQTGSRPTEKEASSSKDEKFVSKKTIRTCQVIAKFGAGMQ